MDEARPRRRLRITIRSMMIATIVVAVDAALCKALMSRPGHVKFAGAAIIVLAYDFLTYFTGLAALQVVRRPWGTAAAPWRGLIPAILVIGICAGLPLGYAILAIMGLLPG